MPQNNPMRRNRSPRPNISKEQSAVDRDLDAHPDQQDPKSQKTRDFSVPLNEYYHSRLVDIADAMSEQVGIKINRRPLAANALREFIDRKSRELGLDKIPEE